MKWQSFIIILVLGLIGCRKEPFQIAQVSGQINFKGKPLNKAHVYFQPMALDAKNLEPGPESYGQTDAEGKFSLRVVILDRPGAVVGKHRVRISKLGVDAKPIDDAGRMPPDPIPAIYNTNTKLTFDVPPEGTDRADFDLR